MHSRTFFHYESKAKFNETYNDESNKYQEIGSKNIDLHK